MYWARIVSFLSLMFCALPASAGVVCTLPFNLTNGTLADATQVMANYNALVACLLNAAQAGNNNDITALNALTTPLTPTQGGTPVYLGAQSTGSGNAQVVATSPTGFALTRDYTVLFVAGFTNTGATQLNVNGTGLTNIFRPSPSGPQAMTGGEIIAGNVIMATYDGTRFQCTNCSGPEFGGFGPQTTIASATSTDLGSIPSHNVVVSGSATITNFGATASLTFPMYFAGFTGAATITRNVTNCTTVGGCIFTPGNANIVTAAGDTAWMLYLGVGSNAGGLGNWQVLFYQKNTGAAVVNPTPNCGFNQLAWGNGASSSTVTAQWGSASLVNSGGIPIYSSGGVGKTLNITTGTSTPTAGGMDGHAPGINTFVYMYAISDGTNFNLLGSPSTTAGSVALPTNYTYICYLGTIKTNGSSNLIGTIGRGSFARYVVGGANLTALPLIVSGTTGSSCTTATPAYGSAVVQGSSGASVWVPATAVNAELVVVGAYNGATPAVILVAPNTSYSQASTTNPPPVSIVTGVDAQASIALESTSVAFCIGAAGGGVVAYGWRDAVNAN